MDLPPADASGPPFAASHQPQSPAGKRISLPRQWLGLLASMRFAISLLTIVAIASIIGTVLKQGEPSANYLNQFGPFWFPAFDALGSVRSTAGALRAALGGGPALLVAADRRGGLPGARQSEIQASHP